MNLKPQLIGINQLLSDMYRQQMRLSYLLARLDFDESDLEQLQDYFLPDVVAIFLTTLDWVVTSAEIEITQFGLIRKIYGLNCGLSNHLGDYAPRTLKDRQIQVIKHSFLSSWEAANCKPRLESELKAKIRQLIVAEENHSRQKQPSYFYNAADNRISDFYRQLIATVNLQSAPTKHRYAEIRKKYKKAYTQWTKEEEQILISNFDRGLGIKEIARLLERQPGAISSRIDKLNLRS